MKMACGYCGTRFLATKNQIRRSKWACTKPKVGFTCSAKCVAMIGVASRNVTARLPPRKLAYSRLNNAIEQGIVIRPEACEKCGKIPERDCLGRSRIEGHHEDYNKPLVVVWLCDPCHKDVTPRACGERNNKAQFTEIQVIEIRKELGRAAGRRGILARLAYDFGVTGKAISDIRDRKTWKHVP